MRYWRSHPEITGIGIAFADDLVGIDLDHCIAEGEIQPWARAIIERLRTYCERSPSGTGMHCLTRGSLPEKRRIVTLPHLGEGCRIEMYDARSPHYFTVTGAAIGEPRIIEPAQAALDELYAQYMRPQTPKAASAPPQSTLSDEVILAKAQQATNAAKFTRLFRGELTEYDGDHSKADLALCGILAFYTDDPAQIDRLFRRSALLRPKWDERHSRDNQTYGDLTIQKVLDPDRPRYGKLPAAAIICQANRRATRTTRLTVRRPGWRMEPRRTASQPGWLLNREPDLHCKLSCPSPAATGMSGMPRLRLAVVRLTAARRLPSDGASQRRKPLLARHATNCRPAATCSPIERKMAGCWTSGTICMGASGSMRRAVRNGTSGKAHTGSRTRPAVYRARCRVCWMR